MFNLLEIKLQDWHSLILNFESNFCKIEQNQANTNLYSLPTSDRTTSQLHSHPHPHLHPILLLHPSPHRLQSTEANSILRLYARSRLDY